MLSAGRSSLPSPFASPRLSGPPQDGQTEKTARRLLSVSDAEGGGAIHSTGLLKVNRCTFNSNTAESCGSALFADIGCSAEITHCTFAHNTGRGAAGVEAATLALKACVLTGSRHGSETADVWRSTLAGSTLTAESCVISNRGAVPLTATTASGINTAGEDLVGYHIKLVTLTDLPPNPVSMFYRLEVELIP
jgi:hypothetical protein